MKRTGMALMLLFATGVTAHADVLLLDAIKAAPANADGGVIRPRTGNSMSQVKTQYGQPGSVKEAVGDPPITRWVYPAYTVYFEHQHVVNVVVHR